MSLVTASYQYRRLRIRTSRLSTACECLETFHVLTHGTSVLSHDLCLGAQKNAVRAQCTETYILISRQRVFKTYNFVS